jgi:amidophosphoribosyltransferase
MALKEKCGVFGIFGKGLDVSRLSFYGLFALQHRGQEASGIAVANGYDINCHKDIGLVTHVYSERHIRKLKGYIAIGHNLYSNTRVKSSEHIQPVIIKDEYDDKFLALVHNGNLPSITMLKAFLEERDIEASACNDSELMAEAIAYYLKEGQDLPQAVQSAFPLFTGCFSLLIMNKDTLIAVRDARGVRPLSMGEIGNGNIVFASETCSFQTIGARFLREIQPGEMLIVTERGIESRRLANENLKLDIFEFVYFSRPDSMLYGKSVYEVRMNSGKELAKEHPLDVDIVIPVPDTATPAAMGYSRQLGIAFEMALIKNRYIHRTFIQPDQHSRDQGVKLKLNPLFEVLRGKRVAIIDDSIVRGTTSQQIVKAVFEAGAKEVHFLVSSPPIKYPDFYGIDTPKQDKLIAANKTLEEIRDFLGVNSLYYLSLDGLFKAIGLPADSMSTACFTGEYPIDLKERFQEISFVI